MAKICDNDMIRNKIKFLLYNNFDKKVFLFLWRLN